MKILIYQEKNKGGHTDIYDRLNYNTLFNDVNEYCEGHFTNSGNKVWLQGIVNLLSTEENEVYFLEDFYTWDFINDFFDIIVYSTANLFHKSYKSAIQMRADAFKKSKIPIYCLSIGAQGCINESPSSVVNGIEKEISDFLESIYKSGGELGLRGYYTKEVLDCVSSNTAVVTGCPSLFQNGRNLKISKEKVEYYDFKSIINGNDFLKKGILNKQSIFIDQDCFSDFFYNTEIYRNDIEKILYSLLDKYGFQKSSLLINNKIQLFMDVPEWGDYIKSNSFNFSFGSRIHGNIISILNGIPALIYPIDSRTKEMAEYYCIPTTNIKPKNQKKLYELYLETSYGKFNNNFPKIYDKFNKFVVEHGLVKKTINTKNVFWNREKPIPNKSIIEKKELLKEYFNKNRVKIWISCKIKKIY